MRPTTHDTRSPALNFARLCAEIEAGATGTHGAMTPMLICAPAGYGKTKLVTAWIESQDLDTVVRLRCTPHSVHTFWEDLRRAVAGDTSTIDAYTELLTLFARIDTPTTIVIDDYHLATTPETDIALLDLINPNVRLVIVARRVSALNDLLAARRVPMIRLGPGDLALTRDEAREYANLFGQPDPALLDAVLNITGGWPLAIRAAIEPATSLGLPTDPGPHTAHDPFAALNRFAQIHFQTVNSAAQQALLAAALLGVVDDTQIAAAADATLAEVRQATHTLLELGFLMPSPSGDIDEFRCHTAVRDGLRARAQRTFTQPQQAALYRGRADKIAAESPVAAFELYLLAGAYDEAEVLLSLHFVTITDEADFCLNALYTLAPETLTEHPTLMAARIYIEATNPHVSAETLWVFLHRWRKGLSQRMTQTLPYESLCSAYLVQSMIAARYLGHPHTAAKIAHELEVALSHTRPPTNTPLTARAGYGARKLIGSGSHSIYFVELAATALATNDFESARRLLEKAQAHTEALIAHPWYGFPTASVRTVTDVESGERWRAAVLYERAFLETLDGDNVTAEKLLTKADAFVQQTDTNIPGLNRTNGACARALIATETRDTAMIRSAIADSHPLRDRLEAWPVPLIAGIEILRYERGIGWALTAYENEFAKVRRGRKTPGRWLNLAVAYHAELNTLLGRFAVTEQLLDEFELSVPCTIIERARLALFSRNTVRAVMLAQSAGEMPLTKRQHVTRIFIAACASWHTGEKGDAVESFIVAMNLVQQYGLRSLLLGLPYATLHDIAVAARDAGHPDLLPILETVPEVARAKEYGRLTDMELRTLGTIEQLGTINDTAEALFVTPATVKKHLSAVYRKLGVKGRDEAVLLASRMALLPLALEP